MLHHYKIGRSPFLCGDVIFFFDLNKRHKIQIFWSVPEMFDFASASCVCLSFFKCVENRKLLTRFIIDHGPAEESAVRSCGMFLVVMSLVCFLSLSYVV